MKYKRVIYLAGPITGVPRYWEAFERVEEDLTALGYAVLSPAKLPEGMSYDAYMQIDLAMLQAADEVWFIPGHADSRGASIELRLCEYTEKRRVCFSTWDAYEQHMYEIRERWSR